MLNKNELVDYELLLKNFRKNLQKLTKTSPEVAELFQQFIHLVNISISITDYNLMQAIQKIEEIWTLMSHKTANKTKLH